MRLPQRAPPPPPPPPLPPGFPPDEDYRPVRGRRKLLIALLALATAVGIVWALARKPSGSLWPPIDRLPAAASAPGAPTPNASLPGCAPGQTEGCVGGRTQMIVVTPPAPPAAAAASR